MITKEEKIIQGQTVEIYTIRNKVMEVSFMNYGGTILTMGLLEESQCKNIAVAYENIEDYFKENSPYLNALIGPIAGRIQNALYKLEESEFQLPQNNGMNHLHGGSDGLHRKFFNVRLDGDCAYLSLHTTHEGFVGTFEYNIVYKLEDTTFTIDYYCVPSVKQVVNLTNHIYVNMDEDLHQNIQKQYLRLPSKRKVAIHKDGYPYQVVDIEKGSAFDFYEEKKIKEAYEIGDKEFDITLGIDAPFLLEDDRKIYLYSDTTKLQLNVETDMESIVVYTANYFNENEVYEGGVQGQPHCCIALETQATPNGIHIDGVSDSVHSVDQPYVQHTSFTLVRRD